jgi:hypothetical protein
MVSLGIGTSVDRLEEKKMEAVVLTCFEHQMQQYHLANSACER